MDGALRDAPPPPPTGVSQAELDERWEMLLADAEQAKLAYMQQRTPVELQPHLRWYIEQDALPPVPPATQAVVNDGDSINVQMWDNSTVPGVAAVANSVLTRVTPNAVASKTIIANNANVVVHDAADAVQPGSPGRATVAAGALTKVTLTV
jgi:hypothetical protein